MYNTGVDWVQENVLGQGKQDNESAVEQAKDEQISGTASTASTLSLEENMSRCRLLTQHT